MSLTVRPRPTRQSRKRQAGHHKQNKRYVKAYLPYLPMIAIVICGVVIDKVWTPGAASAATLNSTAVPVRLATITGNTNFTALYIVLAVTFIAFSIFALTHIRRLHRWVNKGEVYVMVHPMIDVTLLAVATVGVVLTR